MHIIQPLKMFKHKISAELGGNLIPGPQEAYSLVLKTHIKFLNWILNMNSYIYMKDVKETMEGWNRKMSMIFNSKIY